MDGNVDVDPIVDLDLDPWKDFSTKNHEPARGSTCNVDVRVDVYVAVHVKAPRQRQ
jgi:hypothetical protein